MYVVLNGRVRLYRGYKGEKATAMEFSSATSHLGASLEFKPVRKSRSLFADIDTAAEKV